MKKLFFGTIALFLMASCSNGGKAEREREDSIRKADSIAQVEAALAAEQARQDSIRHDSIQMREKAIESIPSFNDFLRYGQNPSYFRKRGFQVSVKKSSNERDGEYKIVKGTYEPVTGVSCKFMDSSVGDDYMEITINGAPEVLNKIYVDAKKYMESQKKENPNYEVRKKGNTIECIFDPYVY